MVYVGPATDTSVTGSSALEDVASIFLMLVMPERLDRSSRVWLRDSSRMSPGDASPSPSAAAFRLAYSSLVSSTSRFRRAIFRSKLSASSSSERSPSSSVPSCSIRWRRLEALYDRRFPSTRSEKSAPLMSIVAGEKRERASLMRSLDREMFWDSSSTPNSSSERVRAAVVCFGR